MVFIFFYFLFIIFKPYVNQIINDPFFFDIKWTQRLLLGVEVKIVH
jgi:hypothetical protein